MNPTLTWTWTTRLGARTYAHEITLTDDAVTVCDESSTPRERRITLADAFARPHMIFVDDPKVRFELFSALAARLDPRAVTAPRDATRLAFWRAYEPSRVQPETFVQVMIRAGRDPEPRVMRLDGYGLHAREVGREREVLHLPDEVFVLGPPLPDTSMHTRETLRQRLFAALRPGHGLTLAESFPRIEHGAIARRTWSWDVRTDGETGATTQPGSVTQGYQYGHDFGWSDHAPERVLAGDPRVHLWAPREIEEAILEVLRAAVRPHPAQRPYTAEPADDFFALRSRAIDRAQWSERAALAVDLTRWSRPYDWPTRVALGLYASIRPGAELPMEPLKVDEFRHRHAYNWGDDRAWIAADGSGVLCAMYCFGGLPGDGVNEVFHVVTGDGQRVMFEACTDSTQNELVVSLSADDPARLASLRAHVEAWMLAYGLPASAERAPSEGLCRTDARSA